MHVNSTVQIPSELRIADLPVLRPTEPPHFDQEGRLVRVWGAADQTVALTYEQVLAEGWRGVMFGVRGRQLHRRQVHAVADMFFPGGDHEIELFARNPREQVKAYWITDRNEIPYIVVGEAGRA
jgi:hypothetical protein